MLRTRRARARISHSLTFNNGTSVSTPQQWMERREELKSLLYDYILGRPPPREQWPKYDAARSVLVNTTGPDAAHGGATSSYHHLSYAVPARAGNTSTFSFFVEVMCPPPVKGTLAPLMLTQWNHRLWGVLAVQRGYCVIVYPGSDVRDAAPALADAYGGVASPWTWMLIIRRALVASLTLDFAQTSLPQANMSQVGITGHSRNGKQSLIAAAIDERIGSVVGSSPGAPIASPFRFTSAHFAGETVEAVHPSRGWWLNSTKAYFGREDHLPADGNFVTALVAPRHLLLATAHNDHESDMPFANERNLEATNAVYTLLAHGHDGHSRNSYPAVDPRAPVQPLAPQLRLVYREGDHHGFLDVHSYLDWFDVSFGRGEDVGALAARFPDARIHAFDWAAWNTTAGGGGAVGPLPPAAAPLRERVQWLLGATPPSVMRPASSLGEQDADNTYIGTMMHVDWFNTSAGRGTKFPVARMPVTLGGYHTAQVYYPANVTAAGSESAPLPAMIWLHPFAYSAGVATPVGYAGGFNVSNGPHTFAEKGFVVVAMDQVGFGRRLLEGPLFYERHPGSSRMAAAVGDVSAVVDLLKCLGPAGAGGGRASPQCNSGSYYTPTYYNNLGVLPAVDASRVFAAGYSLGGAVALHAAALDARIAGAASFSGFTPMRTDAETRPSRGIARWFSWHALVPRLGLFGQGGRPLREIPYDYCELIASIAPRPVLVYAPIYDREANATDIAACVKQASGAWNTGAGNTGTASGLTFEAPADVNRMEVAAILSADAWAERVAGLV